MKIHKPGTDCEIELSISAGGHKCQEFVLPDADDEPIAGVSFIPVPEGAEITIQGTFSGSVLEGRIDVLADGAFVANRIIEHPGSKQGVLKCWEKRRIEVKTFLHVPDLDNHKQRLRPKVVEGRLVAARLKNEDLARPLYGGDNATGIGVGSIALVVSLNQDVFDTYGAEDEATYPSVSLKTWRGRVKDVADSGINPELEMNMDVFPDSDPVKDKRATLFWRDLKQLRPGSEPWAFLIFYYRTQAAIDAAGCIPLSGSKALPADGGLFIRASEQEMVSPKEISDSPSSSPPPAHEQKKKMGLGQALLLPDSQPARDSTSKHTSPVNDHQHQPHTVGTTVRRPTSQTQLPSIRGIQDTALQRMTALANEKKAQVRSDAVRNMSEQQRQQASAARNGHLVQQNGKQDIIGRRDSVQLNNTQQQQKADMLQNDDVNMSLSVEREKDSLFESAREITIIAGNEKNASTNFNFDLAPPLTHPLLSSKHADNLFPTPKPQVSFTEPLIFSSAKDLSTSGSMAYDAASKHQIDDLATPSLPAFGSRSPTDRPAVTLSKSPTAQPQTKPSHPVKPTVHPVPRKRPVPQLDLTAPVPADPFTETSPSSAKRLKSEEMQQRKARLEAELKAKRERKAAIKKANDEEELNRQKQQRLWAEEDAKRREEEARRREAEEEEARKAEEVFMAEMEALERENELEDEDLESEIEKGERQRMEWEELMKARGCSEGD
ncbi:hypothetical protein MBLNU13_g06021t3 [Cladosporium sp. NU13]